MSPDGELFAGQFYEVTDLELRAFVATWMGKADTGETADDLKRARVYVLAYADAVRRWGVAPRQSGANDQGYQSFNTTVASEVAAQLAYWRGEVAKLEPVAVDPSTLPFLPLTTSSVDVTPTW